MGVAQFARECGARVVVIDTNAERLAFCRDKLGIEMTLNPSEDDINAALKALSDDELADVAFDATGSPTAMQAGFDLLGQAGRYVLVSIVKADISFHDPDFHRKELTLIASRNATRADFDHVTHLMESGRLKVDAMITHRAELADVPERMPAWCTPATGVVKAMIEISGHYHRERRTQYRQLNASGETRQLAGAGCSAFSGGHLRWLPPPERPGRHRQRMAGGPAGVL